MLNDTISRQAITFTKNTTGSDLSVSVGTSEAILILTLLGYGSQYAIEIYQNPSGVGYSHSVPDDSYYFVYNNTTTPSSSDTDIDYQLMDNSDNSIITLNADKRVNASNVWSPTVWYAKVIVSSLSIDWASSTNV